MPLASMQSLLIVRLGAVGDGLMLAPALACLRRAHPGARIDLTGVVWRLRLLAGPTLASSVRAFEDFVDDGCARAESFDGYEHVVVFAIDLDNLAVRAIAAAAPDRVTLHASFPITRASDLHVADHVQRCFAQFGIPEHADRRYQLPLPDAAREQAEQFLSPLRSRAPRVYLQPGTRIATKLWPSERFVALGRALAGCGWQVFLGCGPLDAATVAPIERGLAGVNFVRAFGQDLTTTAGVLAQMDLCIGADSGITHLAAIVGTPTIALFGPTRPQLWGPVGPRVHVLTGRRGLTCCDDDHPRTCAGGCMAEISVERVLAAVAATAGAHRG